MKTPEKYISKPEDFKNLPTIMGKAAYSKNEMMNALKSMQEDHEKELKSIELSLERIESSLYAADPIMEDVCIKDIRGQVLELLTQFRNKQQDR